jgi:hypothetical protein
VPKLRVRLKTLLIKDLQPPSLIVAGDEAMATVHPVHGT